MVEWLPWSATKKTLAWTCSHIENCGIVGPDSDRNVGDFALYCEDRDKHLFFGSTSVTFGLPSSPHVEPGLRVFGRFPI